MKYILILLFFELLLNVFMQFQTAFFVVFFSSECLFCTEQEKALLSVGVDL